MNIKNLKAKYLRKGNAMSALYFKGKITPKESIKLRQLIEQREAIRKTLEFLETLNGRVEIIQRAEAGKTTADDHWNWANYQE